MKREDDLLKKINEKHDKMSKGQKKIANYVSVHYEKAAFLTAANLGKEVGVSESTIVRFAMLLGYEGYPEFSRALEEMVREKLHSVDTIEITSSCIDKTKILDTVINSDINKLKYTLETIDRESFDEAVDSIISAKKIYIVGIRGCAPLASMLGFSLNLIFDNVVCVTTNSSSEMFEQMIRLSKKDVVIGMSFPRYSMRTLKALEFANNRQAKVIAITDDKNSPLNLYSSCNILAKSEMSSVIESLTAPLSVINALVMSIYVKKQKEVTKTLEELEKIWDDYQVYAGDEMSLFDETVIVNDMEK